MLRKIIASGEAGVNRAALDMAAKRGVSLETMDIPAHDDGEESSSLNDGDEIDCAARVETNVLKADGTLILTVGELWSESKQAAYFSNKYQKPCLVIYLGNLESSDRVIEWLHLNKIVELYVTGPREHDIPGIYHLACRFLDEVLGHTAYFS